MGISPNYSLGAVGYKDVLIRFELHKGSLGILKVMCSIADNFSSEGILHTVAEQVKLQHPV